MIYHNYVHYNSSFEYQQHYAIFSIIYLYLLNLLDVDECQFRRCEHNCTNSYGTFYCTCDEGFELTDDLFCAGLYMVL